MWTHHLEISEAPTVREIGNAILNPLTLEQRADIDDVEEGNGERPASNKENMETLSMLGTAVEHRAVE